MSEVEIKRGYAKWTDENGVFHKVPVQEYNNVPDDEESDEDMGNQIQDLMFVFENLADVDDRGMQAILRDVQQDALMKAIKGADDALKEKIMTNMSKRAAEMLADDLEAMGPVRISEVETAQKEILSVARRLADAGEIMLGGSGEEML